MIDDRAPRRRLLLVHGWGLGSAVWEPLLPTLAEHWRTDRVDLPGYRATADGSDDFDATARDLVTAMASPPLTLCGWSLGGLLALRAALLAPQRVRGLVLVATTPSFVRRAGWSDAQAPELVEALGDGVRRQPEATLRRFVTLLNRGDGKARSLARQHLGHLQQDPRPSAAALKRGLDWLSTVDLRTLLPTIDTPCLLIHGGQDSLIPLAAAQQLASTLPRARLEVFADAGHVPFHHDRERFCRLLAQFNDELAA